MFASGLFVLIVLFDLLDCLLVVDCSLFALDGCWFLLVYVVRVGCFLGIIWLFVWFVLAVVYILGIVVAGCLPRWRLVAGLLVCAGLCVCCLIA